MLLKPRVTLGFRVDESSDKLGFYMFKDLDTARYRVYLICKERGGKEFLMLYFDLPLPLF
jgi:hypothetical protein